MGDGLVVEGFGARTAAAIDKTGPLCAGVDPSESLLRAWGLSDDAAGLREFGARCVEAFAGVVPAVKPQVAFFERFGAAGMAALETLIRDAQESGLLVIADAKRGDIGSTMEAYASTWLDPRSPLCADAVTATPYLGLGSLQPMFDLAAEHGRGVIVVVRTSNPEGRALQEARTESGRGPAVEDMLLERIAELNAGGLPVSGTVGVVVGATLAPSKFSLGSLGGPILAPGVGAQGATADDVGKLFRGCKSGSVLASASRSLLAAGPDLSSLRAAALASREEMAAALG
jgi:orotidine-5'-phosphate decarboxylase